MALVTKPMLAETVLDPSGIRFPVLATYKVDGIRALKHCGDIKSRTLKAIRNSGIAGQLARVLPEGADGEILVGQNFQLTTSTVMSYSTSVPPDTKFYWFDWVHESLGEPYCARVQRIREYMVGRAGEIAACGVRIVPLYPTLIRNRDELGAFEQRAIAEGFEGVIVRDPSGPYKCGRSTLRQGWMLKIKQFVDDEAVVIGSDELMHNGNEATRDERGHTKRSQDAAGMVPGGVLASFRVRHRDGTVFNIGTGFTAADRERLWKVREECIGKWVKYKSFPIGVKDAPRHPVFLGFRDPDDM
ncbi:hypothetical protein GGF32_002718 [Allomyces javanicus]|nr:hypothetical protein GGF32_002718 [Allomyces javanicus]